MRNGYFKLIKTSSGYGVSVYVARDGGEPVVAQELLTYLESNKIPYDIDKIKKATLSKFDNVVELGEGDCPSVREAFTLSVSGDNMRAVARFTPRSDTGERMTAGEFVRELAARNVKYGLDEERIKKFFSGPGVYCTDFVVAEGKKPRQGKDAEIEYFFNTDNTAKPKMNPDGTVDYFDLGILNQVKAGDLLARITPEDPGEPGMTVQGTVIKPGEVKRIRHNFGKNIKLSDDKLTITSEVDGMITLDGETVCVSDTYEVENVDPSTGNIDFTGTVQVNGNIAANFEVRATGDVIVYGVVEGAHVVAGGSIIIARGMKGMGKGVLEAGNNVVAKFIENSFVKAGGYVNTESILHSEVMAGTEVTVTGKHGFITGGHISADSKVEVKNLGATMGSQTIVEVGADPVLKLEYNRLQREIALLVRSIKEAQPVIQNFMAKKARGVQMTAEQLAYVRATAAGLEEKKKELEQMNARMKELSAMFDPDRPSAVIVNGDVYPGTTVIIGDVSMNVKESYKYCKFVREKGEVKITPL
jgi:uncharacterized protein (DUF342 family)